VGAIRQIEHDLHDQPRGRPRALSLIQGSLAGSRVDRQAPWLAGLHRLVDGSLIGLGVSVLTLAGLTLHWQYRWSHSFETLETAKVLEHRLKEATATLERAYLGPSSRPTSMVATSTANLLYLPRPQQIDDIPAAPMAVAEVGDLSGLSQEPVRRAY